MLLNSSSLHAACGSRAGSLLPTRGSVASSCGRLTSKPVLRPSSAAPRARSSRQRFDRLVGRVAEASSPAEAADVQIDLNNDEDKEYTVSRGMVELRRCQRVSALFVRKSCPYQHAGHEIPRLVCFIAVGVQVLYLSGANRPGLLTALSAALRELGLDVSKVRREPQGTSEHV
jgi:hypothetical protein